MPPWIARVRSGFTIHGSRRLRRLVGDALAGRRVGHRPAPAATAPGLRAGGHVGAGPDDIRHVDRDADERRVGLLLAFEIEREAAAHRLAGERRERRAVALLRVVGGDPVVRIGADGAGSALDLRAA
jgi:hypothetical protein